MRLAAVAGTVLAMGITGATAHGNPIEKDQAHLTDDGIGAAAPIVEQGRSSFSNQDGGAFSHLPAARENIEVVSKLSPQSQGPIVPGQIADVAVFKNTAYLMSWNRGTAENPCSKGGFYSVDISNPAAPRELAFRAAEPGTYHGEGAHAISINTPSFKGDILGVNNEPCVAAGTGGFDLYDVTDPANPKPLVIAAGDRTPSSGTTPRAKPNSSHSTFLWQAGDKAYAAIVDNIESTDVDIFDITDPRNPQMIGDYNLAALFPQIVGSSANGDSVFLHDMVVKEINGRQIMLASYWDAGYVQIDVTDPTKPTLVGDTDFGTTDPLTGKVPPEGNGHYGEFSFDNRYMLTADEDFSPSRLVDFRITGPGPNAGEQYPGGEFGFTKQSVTLEDNTVNGPTVYGGYGCDASGANGGIPARSAQGFTLAEGEEAIVVLQRGPVDDPNNPITACTFQEKVENAEAAGYDAVIIANHHVGADEGESPDAALCGSGTGADIFALCAGHRMMHDIFEEAEEYAVPYTTPPSGNEPEIGDQGQPVSSTSEFDGWGYAHLYDRATGREIGAYAIQEALDERYAAGFGDLSIHEWATDPTEYLAYSAYYAGGVRVAQFGDFGIRETGKFIDQGGSNFWGIEQFTSGSGERLLAASDRDYGLYILRYTGPGAAVPPRCEDLFVATNGEPITIALKCTDANGNPMTLSIAKPPVNGTLSAIDQGNDTVVYTPRAGANGRDTFTYIAFDGAANSNIAQVQILVGRCANPINGTAAGELLNGTQFGDTIKAGAGNDTIGALQGDDCVFGEAGDDRIVSGAGNDQVDGGLGKDRLFGDSGNDAIRGGTGVDHVRGSSGNDVVRGDAGNDFVSGGSNNDRVIGGAGRDSLRGDSGNDVIRGDGGNDAIDAGKGRNRVAAGGGNDRINVVNGSKDRVTCGTGRDVVRADRADRVARSCERVLRTRTTRR